MSDETPMATIICPVCARLGKLQTYTADPRRVPRDPPIKALYTCEGGHEIRMTVTRLPDFSGAA
jgi:hypothetical protein